MSNYHYPMHTSVQVCKCSLLDHKQSLVFNPPAKNKHDLTPGFPGAAFGPVVMLAEQCVSVTVLVWRLGSSWPMGNIHYGPWQGLPRNLDRCEVDTRLLTMLGRSCVLKLSAFEGHGDISNMEAICHVRTESGRLFQVYVPVAALRFREVPTE